MPRNGTAAYARVYPDANYDTAKVAASRMLDDPRVIAEIERREAQLHDDLAMTAQDVIRDICLIATADPRELSEHHTGACRYCHGTNHKYQRTQNEYARDVEAHIDRRALDKERGPDPLGLEFDAKGGIGFNPYKDPHPQCPECFGKGESFEVFKDTRTLSKGAARLYQGVKRTRDGLEIKIRSQDKAIELAMQTLGLAKTKLEHSGPNGGPIPSTNVNVSTVTNDPVEAANLYKTLLGK